MARNEKLAVLLGDDLSDRIVGASLVTPADVEKASDDELIALLELTDAELAQIRAVFPKKEG
jgi:hypothetical protein